MTSKPGLVTEPAERVLLLTRVFNAPPAVVFKAWTEPDQVMRWWGPHGFKVISCEMDVRTGGKWLLCMRGPDGADTWQHFIYRQIVPSERLVFAYAFADAAGNTGHETLVTVIFAEAGNKTTLTLHQAIFESVGVRDDHTRGWGEALDHLADYVIKAPQE
jgi:uncharacterized protein YndB with AHSA1/START domain